jgi:hypothetical protein
MMFFSKPVAKIYVSELLKRYDPLVVPVFTPDSKVEVGDFGSFEDGRFVRRGNVSKRGVTVDADSSPVAPYDYASSGKVEIGPSVEVPTPTGGTLLKTTLDFKSANAVVVSFKEGQDVEVKEPDDFADALTRAWYTKVIPVNRVVVWSIRRMNGGTVIVSESGDNSLEVIADPALLLGAAGITTPNLSVGVTFGAERNATWKVSVPATPLVAWIRLLRLRGDRAADVFGFQPTAQGLDDKVASKPTEGVPVDDLLEQLSDDADESTQ